MSLPTSVPYLFLLFVAGACSSRSHTRTTPATVPTFDARKFSQPAEITNPYFRLIPGTTHLHVVEDAGSVEIVVMAS